MLVATLCRMFPFSAHFLLPALLLSLQLSFGPVLNLIYIYYILYESSTVFTAFVIYDMKMFVGPVPILSIPPCMFRVECELAPGQEPKFLI